MLNVGKTGSWLFFRKTDQEIVQPKIDKQKINAC